MKNMMGFGGKSPGQQKADGYRGNRAGSGGGRAAMMRSMLPAGEGQPPQPVMPIAPAPGMPPMPPNPFPMPPTLPGGGPGLPLPVPMPLPGMEPPVSPFAPRPKASGWY